MCGIGAIVSEGILHSSYRYGLVTANTDRGRDGYGSFVNGNIYKTPGVKYSADETEPFAGSIGWRGVGMFNCRAEPTTERVENPGEEDAQPYTVGNWTIVHNGTIANDKELIALHEFDPPTKIDSWVIAALLDDLERTGDFEGALDVFGTAVKALVGSYAILAVNKRYPEAVYYATNYRPLYFQSGKSNGLPFIAVSSVKIDDKFLLIEPYTFGVILNDTLTLAGDLLPEDVLVNNKALVILSGGLDSTVVAAKLIQDGYNVSLLHYTYGCRAESNEAKAVKAIAEYLGAPLQIVDLTSLFSVIGNSRLLDPNATFAEKETGAEQAIEWVPARNTILASIAMGIAEANGIGTIALGINLEESGGGYTDNVLDLYEGLNRLSHWIVGVNKKVEFISPVGGLMKHEIVALGLETNAPLHLTWSCYNQGTHHCGNCGPCYMRKRAFEMNGSVDPVFCHEITG